MYAGPYTKHVKKIGTALFNETGGRYLNSCGFPAIKYGAQMNNESFRQMLIDTHNPNANELCKEKPPFGKFARSHDLQNLYVNLRQWRVLHAVVDCNGFSEAAEFLHMSQSAVSHSIAKLQEQLGLQLINPGRKLQLTPAGRDLINRSRYLLKAAVQLEQCAARLRHGNDAEISMVVDTLFPSEFLFSALDDFYKLYPRMPIRLREVGTAVAAKLLTESPPDLAISATVPLPLLAEPLLRIPYVAVGSPSHPLAQFQRPITHEDLVGHFRVEFNSTEQRETALNRSMVWSMDTLQSAAHAIEAGLAYGWLPRHHIDGHIANGTLVELPLAECRTYVQTLYLVRCSDGNGHPAVNDLADVVRGIGPPIA